MVSKNPQVQSGGAMLRRAKLQVAAEQPATLAQNQFAIARQLRFDFLKQILIRNVGAAHFVLMLGQNLARLFVDAIFDGEFLRHALAEPERYSLRGSGFNQATVNKLLDDFGGHVTDIVSIQEHWCGVPSQSGEIRVYWVGKQSARKADSKGPWGARERGGVVGGGIFAAEPCSAGTRPPGIRERLSF
jgi:hypothetical protein